MFFRPRATTNKAAAPARNRSERSEPSDRANRAPDDRRSDERTRFSFAKNGDDVDPPRAMREQHTTRWLVATLLLLACLVTGCSYDRVEPGLFGRPMSETTAPPLRPITPSETLPSPNPDLPVVGEAIWTSADGLDITMRLAVHAGGESKAPRCSTGR